MLRTDSRHWRWAFVIWFTVLTVMTHLPRSNPLGAEHRPPDKLLHYAAFGLAALLLVRTRWLPTWIALLLLLAWVPFDEWTQSLVSEQRMFEWADIIGGALGVATVGVLAAALSRPKVGADAWRRYDTCFDHVTSPTHGGLVALVSGALAGGGTLVGLYTALFRPDNPWPGTVAMLMGIVVGLATCGLVLLRRWLAIGGPRVPMPGLHWWLIALVGSCMAFMVGAGMGEYGLPSLGTPSMLFVFVLLLSIGIRRRLDWACAHAQADVTDTHV